MVGHEASCSCSTCLSSGWNRNCQFLSREWVGEVRRLQNTAECHGKDPRRTLQAATSRSFRRRPLGNKDIEQCIGTKRDIMTIPHLATMLASPCLIERMRAPCLINLYDALGPWTDDIAVCVYQLRQRKNEPKLRKRPQIQYFHRLRPHYCFLS